MTSATPNTRRNNPLKLDFTQTCFNCPSRCIKINHDSKEVTLYCGCLYENIGNFAEPEIMIRKRPSRCPRNIRNIKKEKKAI